jgi:hypothetical protein
VSRLQLKAGLGESFLGPQLAGVSRLELVGLGESSSTIRASRGESFLGPQLAGVSCLDLVG